MGDKTHHKCRGQVYSFTHMTSVPAGFEQTANYTMALVQMEEDLASPHINRLGRPGSRNRHAGGDGHPQNPHGHGRTRHHSVRLQVQAGDGN